MCYQVPTYNKKQINLEAFCLISVINSIIPFWFNYFKTAKQKCLGAFQVPLHLIEYLQTVYENPLINEEIALPHVNNIL